MEEKRHSGWTVLLEFLLYNFICFCDVFHKCLITQMDRTNVIHRNTFFQLNIIWYENKFLLHFFVIRLILLLNWFLNILYFIFFFFNISLQTYLIVCYLTIPNWSKINFFKKIGKKLVHEKTHNCFQSIKRNHSS